MERKKESIKPEEVRLSHYNYSGTSATRCTATLSPLTHARTGRLTYCRLLLLRQTHKAQRLSVSALFADKMSFL